MLHAIAMYYVKLFNNIATTYYVCFFLCMKKKQKIKLLELLTEKEGNQRLVEATF